MALPADLCLGSDVKVRHAEHSPSELPNAGMSWFFVMLCDREPCHNRPSQRQGGSWWVRGPEEQLRHYVPLARPSGHSMAPPPSLPSPATAALPGAFPTCSQPSEKFSDLSQEVLPNFCPTPEQRQSYILTLLQAVCGQDQGHVQRRVLDHAGDRVLLKDFGVGVGKIADDSHGLVAELYVVLPWFLLQDAGKVPGYFWSWFPCC